MATTVRQMRNDDGTTYHECEVPICPDREQIENLPVLIEPEYADWEDEKEDYIYRDYYDDCYSECEPDWSQVEREYLEELEEFQYNWNDSRYL